MNRLLFFFFLFTTTALSNELEVIFIPDQQNPMQGKCVERDIATQGKRFVFTLPLSRCQILQPTSTAWDAKSQKCFTVDVASGGKQFIALALPENCRPEKTAFLWNSAKSLCQEVDAQTMGQNFAISAPTTKCRPAKTAFKLQKKGSSWECSEVDEATQGETFVAKTDLKNCQSSDIVYFWKQVTEISGSCFQGSNDRPKEFFLQVTQDKCLKTPIAKSFLVPAGKTESVCVQYAEGPNGEKMTFAISKEDCPRSETVLLWSRKSLTKGECLSVDKATMGKAINIVINKESCRTPQTEFLFLGESKSCYEVDKETQGNHFILEAKPENCLNATGLEWKPDSTGLSGQCYKILSSPSGPMRQTLPSTACRPEKLAYRWKKTEEFKGACLEYDSEKLSIYVNQVRSDFCRPKETIFMFKAKSQIQGDCFEVDKKTNGEEFIVLVGPDKCRPE